MKKGLTYPPPQRVWFPTGNLTEDGARKFTSRDWRPGEKAEYTAKLQAPEDLAPGDDD